MSDIEIRRLRFDEWNREHLARPGHNVSEREAREVVANPDAIVLMSYKDRPLFLGRTRAGRMLVIVLDPEGNGVYYPVSGRPASKKERELYKQLKTRNTP